MAEPPDLLLSSMCDYSKYIYARMDLLQQSPQVPSVHVPTRSVSELKTYMQGLRLLSRLTDRQSIPHTKEQIIDISPKQTNVLYSLWQHLVSVYQTQNPLDDLIATKNTVDRTLQCLNSSSDWEFIAGFHEQINLLYKLRKYTIKSIESGFPTYLKTVGHIFKLTNNVSDDRSRVANEISASLNTLQNSVKVLIENFEECNKKNDLQHVKRFVELLRNPSAHNRDYYFQYGFPTLIVNSAAKEYLRLLFGQALVDRVYRFYRLEYKGMIRLHDVHALVVGLIAHMTPSDILPTTISLDELLTYFRKIPLDTINPRVCYKDQLARDIAFLKASNSMTSLKRPFQIHRYIHVKHYLEGMAPIFINSPNCQTSQGMLFCDLDGCYKQLFFLQGGQEPFALVIKSEPSATVRIILTTLESTSTVDEIEQRLKALISGQHEPVVIEICVPYDPKATKGTALRLLLLSLHSIVDLKIGVVKIHLGGPQEVSLQTNMAFLELAKKRPEIVFQVRYFLSNKASFKYGAQSYFGSLKPNEPMPSNLEVSVFNVLNEDNFSSIFTHNLEDCELLVGQDNKVKAGLTHPQKINELFFPAQTMQPGYINSAVNSLWSLWKSPPK